MTRIIAGRAGSITLDVPDAGTRPTSDRVRESLFGALESSGRLEDARVLDLYAGSGALAYEALSRGALSADLVESSARAATIAERNATRVRRALATGTTPPAITVHRLRAEAFLRGERGPYDLVFVDPPYALGEEELHDTLRALLAALSEDALVVIERASRTAAPSLPAGLVLQRSHRYGDTTLWWCTPGHGDDQPETASQSR